MTEILRSPDTDKGFPSEEDEPILHVGESSLNSKGTSWKHGCSCTPLDQCIQSNDYHGISKRKRRKKNSNNNNDSIVSDDEKSLLNQFRQKEKRNKESWDIGPIGGEL